MEGINCSEVRSANCGGRAEVAGVESLRFDEEIQRTMAAPPETGSSFTALLELPANQAMELLHSSGTPVVRPGFVDNHSIYRTHLPNCTPTFPCNAALLERASRFPVLAAENSREPSSIPSNSSGNSHKVKQELVDPPIDSNSAPILSNPVVPSSNKKSTKRKEREKKGTESSKKSKSVANEDSGDGEELPYVHVRARRGQATDSHSLAERARREKINARMKLLQELVPGCNKISGTALVLEEIINHVQSLQRQVEFLSMRLAAVNPRIDLSLDSLFAAEGETLTEGTFPTMVMPLMWSEGQVNNNRRQYQQLWHLHGLITLENSSLTYDTSTNSAPVDSNQLKKER